METFWTHHRHHRHCLFEFLEIFGLLGHGDYWGTEGWWFWPFCKSLGAKIVSIGGFSWHLHVLSPIVWPSPHWVTVFHSPARPLKNLPPLVHPHILLQVSVSSNIGQWGVGVANCQFQPWRIGRTCSYHRPTLGVQEGTSQASHDLGAVVHVLGRVWCP